MDLLVGQGHNELDALVRFFGVRALVLTDNTQQTVVNYIVLFVTVQGQTQTRQLERVLYQLKWKDREISNQSTSVQLVDGCHGNLQ